METDFSGIRNNGKLPEVSLLEVPEDIGDLLVDYIESTQSGLDELESAALAYEESKDRQENGAKIRRILHKLKGEAGVVGIDAVNDFCHQAESAFEELSENERCDMLLRFKDWVSGAIENISNQAV